MAGAGQLPSQSLRDIYLAVQEMYLGFLEIQGKLIQ